MSTTHEIVDNPLERPVLHYGRLEYTSEKLGDTSEHHFVSLDGVTWKEITRRPTLADYEEIEVLMGRPCISATKGFLVQWGATFEVIR